MEKRHINWDRLDNTANLFPVITNESMSNVYRISVTLKEDINPEILQSAVEMVLPYFDMFRYKLKNGIFWYYFEEIHKPFPKIVEESTYPCQFINSFENNDYLCRVTYYKQRINLEVFHAVSDGNGSLQFLKEITYQYLRLAHPEELGEKIPHALSQNTSLDREDSYLSNYKHSAKKPYVVEPAVTIKGHMLPKAIFGITHGYMSVGEIKTVAKKYGITINQYLVGVYVWSIYKEVLGGMPSKKPIAIACPVNLRNYFDSSTMRNFFVVVSCVFKPEKEDYTFEEVLQISADCLKKQVTKENLEKRFSYNVSNEKNMALRMVPLFVKNIGIHSIYWKSCKANTSTITNMGVFTVDEEYESYIDKFHIVLSMTKGQNIKGAICSYGDTLTITFSSAIEETKVLKTFFRRLVEDGISVSIDTNGVGYE